MIAGGILGYTSYDVMHYAMHHGPLQGILKVRHTYRPYTLTSSPPIHNFHLCMPLHSHTHVQVLKTKHMDHHFKVYKESFGITNFFWDMIFGTLPQDYSKITEAAADEDRIKEGVAFDKTGHALPKAAKVEVSATTSPAVTRRRRE